MLKGMAVMKRLGRREDTQHAKVSTARGPPGEWYQADLAATTGKHPSGREERLKPQRYQKAVVRERSELSSSPWTTQYGHCWSTGRGTSSTTGGGEVDFHEVAKMQDALGSVQRYKSRLAAKGYLQKEGIDFEGVCGPVSKHTILRALLATIVRLNLEVHQLMSRRRFSLIKVQGGDLHAKTTRIRLRRAQRGSTSSASCTSCSNRHVLGPRG